MWIAKEGQGATARLSLPMLFFSLAILVCIENIAGKHQSDSTPQSPFSHSPLRNLGGGSLQPPKSFVKKQQPSLNDRLNNDVNHVDPLIAASYVSECNLPTDIGMFRLRAYRIPPSAANPHMGTEPCVIYYGEKPPFDNDGKWMEHVPVRVHDQCFTSEVFRSKRCDCKEQLKMSLQYIKQHGGAIIYMQQEGRGIGLANKVAAYALQDQGLDTVDANIYLGLPEDCRQYGAVPSILSDLQIASVQLITNNPRKVTRLRALGVNVTGTIPMVVQQANPHNRRYLETKQERMKHLNFGDMLARSETSFQNKREPSSRDVQ